ncbi:hypothetical protein GCM10010276_33870 [Streptomyces longisporus]|uniref:Uncharacterized protein n=1 Tax=Streptomyces longisporus TaxID=1948 RepID=A0ABN3LWT3_STRLO
MSLPHRIGGQGIGTLAHRGRFGPGRGFTVLRARGTEYEQHTAFQAFTCAFTEVTREPAADDPALTYAAVLLHGGVRALEAIPPLLVLRDSGCTGRSRAFSPSR